MKRNLQFSQGQIDLIIFALGIAEQTYSDLYRSELTVANARGGNMELKKKALYLHEQSGEFYGLSETIRHGSHDV